MGTWELVRFGFHSSLTTSVQSISGTLVPVILGRAAGTAAVGVYRVARLPIIAANAVQTPMRMAMFPEQSRLVAQGRMAEVRRSTKGYTLIAFGVGIVGAAVAYVIMPWLIPFLYSSSFESAVTPARIMLVAAVFNFALLWRKTLLAALGRPEVRTRLAALETVGAAGGVGGPGGSGSGGRSDRGVGRCGRGRSRLGLRGARAHG